MIDTEPTEPRICRGCTINPCKGEPWTCAQDLEDGRSDYEYERKRDESL